MFGGAGICKASIVLLEQAYKKNNYDYYHLMTGTDLLLKPFDEFDSFFERNLYKITVAEIIKQIIFQADCLIEKFVQD